MRSKSSGASVVDPGDAKTPDRLIECKMTMGKIPTFIRQFEKIAEEAHERGKTPMLALRYYDPDSHLADRDGWIDVVLLRAGEAAELIDDHQV